MVPGDLLTVNQLNSANAVLEANSGKKVKVEDAILGIVNAALNTESWLSAASFQYTIKVIVSSSLRGDLDTLQYPKENVIIGRKVPIGRHYRKLNGIDPIDENNELEVSE